MNPRDLALQGLTPTIMVPRFEAFAPLETVGHRFLAASDGLWLEIRRAWLYACLPVATQTQVPMPYGDVAPQVDLTCGKLPRELLAEFVAKAKLGMPNEVAAAVIWNEQTEMMRLQMLEAISASPGHVTYRQPDTGEGEHVVADLHSHGSADAFFSTTDNQDDQGSIKIAGVVGNIDQQEQTYAFRLCALGLFLTL